MPYADPQKDFEYHQAYRKRPEVRARARASKYWLRTDTRIKTRERNLLRKFGLTTQDWNKLFEKQGSCCAACGTTETRGRYGWATDHDHVSGKVRGILCHRCNTELGLLENRVRRVLLEKYLEKHQ